jgi:SHS2 domain-containing protein
MNYSGKIKLFEETAPMHPDVSPRGRRPKYRQLPHTADLGWRIWGDSLPELFENAAAALVSTLTDRRRLRLTETREISLGSGDRESLLVDWLNHLLYLFDVDGFLGRDFRVASLTPRRLRARVRGEKFDPSRHPEKTGVKAATYHQLKIGREAGVWQATVVFDL